MTVTSLTNKVSYTGNGSTTNFAFLFKVFADADLEVTLQNTSTKVETAQSITTHYTVAGAGNESGGSITMATPPTSSQKLTIKRSPAITQGISYEPRDPFPADTHETGLDRITMIGQALDEANDRSIKLPKSTTLGDITFPEAVSGDETVKWNSGGTALEIGPTSAEISGAATSASAAATSATAAATSATAAATSATAAATSATAAATSQSAAATSATAAATSATAAATSATNAATSATAAATSATNAATSATNAANSATAAATSQSAAATSATAAATSQSAAATSATAAATSQSAAATSATAAAASAASISPKIRWSADADGMDPLDTNGCADAATHAFGTDKPDLRYLAFSASANEHCGRWIDMPDEYDGSAIKVKIEWTHPSTSTNFNVVWRAAMLATGDDDSLDTDFSGSSAAIVETGGTTHDLYKTAEMTITPTGSAAAGDSIYLRIARQGADGSDTMAVDAWFVSVSIEIDL